MASEFLEYTNPHGLRSYVRKTDIVALTGINGSDRYGNRFATIIYIKQIDNAVSFDAKESVDDLYTSLTAP